jgi:hypothetical protein
MFQVNIPPGQNNPGGFSLKNMPVLQYHSHGHGSRRFSNDFGSFPQYSHGFYNIVFRGGKDLIDIRSNDTKGSFTQ